MRNHFSFLRYIRYILAAFTAMALCIAGAGLTPANAAKPIIRTIEAKTVTTTVDNKTVLSETQAGAVRLTLPGILTSQRQISLADVPEEYLEATQATPIASTELSHGAVSSYQTDTGTQTLIRIDSTKAAKEYRFPLTLTDGTTPQLLEDGSILIKDAHGEVLGGYKTPWAIDANGAHVPTQFRLEDDMLIQTVNFTPEAVFPIIADPQWWQFGVSVAAGSAVTAALVGIPGAGIVAGAAGGCTTGAMNAMFDGKDFWGAFHACLGYGALGGWGKTVYSVVAKVIARFR